MDEVLTPFFLFQYFSLVIWYNEGYAAYSTALLVITIISIISSIYDTLQANARIRKMAETKCRVTVLRCGKEIVINQSDIVPGDLVTLSERDVAELVQVPVDMVVT